MVNWAQFEAAEPEIAGFALAQFNAFKHKTIATLRADGSPRISGNEIGIYGGEVWIGGMPGARRFSDLRRDPRVAIHSGSADPAGDGGWSGDAKLSGTAVEVTDPAERKAFAKGQPQMPPGSFELFRVDISEVTTVRIGVPADHLDIDLWQAGEGVQRFRR